MPANAVPRVLLATVTDEPYQPVRLYASIPSKAVVTRIFGRMRCMDEDKDGGRWVWLYDHEARSLTFGKPRAEIPAAAHPIVIGSVRFPEQGSMTIEVRSIDRAIAAARFFAPALGESVVFRRARLVNRLFAIADVSSPDLGELDAMLDRDVTRIDPQATEERLRQYLAGSKTPAEAELAWKRFDDDERRKGVDVPLVEDFPLAPEEETKDFLHLSNTLRFRGIRAYEHWRGNTHLTLRDIIVKAVEEQAAKMSPPRRKRR